MTLVHFLGPDGELVPVSASNPLPTGSAVAQAAEVPDSDPPEVEEP